MSLTANAVSDYRGEWQIPASVTWLENGTVQIQSMKIAG
jgi:hypothetical protein